MNQKERSEWIERAKQRVLENAKITDEWIKEIMFLFDEAAIQLETELNAMFQKYASENGLTNAEASKMLTGSEYSRWKKSIEEYIKEAEGDSKTLLELNTLAAKSRISRKEQMLAAVYKTMITLSKDTESKVTELMGGLYKTNYYRGCYDVQSILGIGFQVSKVDVKMLRRILEHPWSGKNYSQALWENTDKLAALAKRELTLGFMTGSSVQKMAKKIDDVMQKGRYAAERLVRTESSYFSNQGELASYKKLGIKEYVFLGGGCDDCLALNGKSFLVDEAEAGINLPPIHPNCKCTIKTKAKRDLFQDRKGVNPLNDNPKFEEWKKKYVKENGGKEFEKAEIHDKITLPRASEAVMAEEKFTKYALNPEKAPDKARAFKTALGYDLTNYKDLMADIRKNLTEFPAKEKPDNGYGKRYEVVMNLKGPNGKTAKVLTAWLDDKNNGEMRMASLYIDS